MRDWSIFGACGGAEGLITSLSWLTFSSKSLLGFIHSGTSPLSIPRFFNSSNAPSFLPVGLNTSGPLSSPPPVPLFDPCNPHRRQHWCQPWSIASQGERRQLLRTVDDEPEERKPVFMLVSITQLASLALSSTSPGPSSLTTTLPWSGSNF
jgi:hypothetical protein